MDGFSMAWPTDSMDFWKIENIGDVVTVRWSHNYFEDYKVLAFNFFECGYYTFAEVIRSGHDNIKSDTWFLPGIFLMRHSIELGVKALLCRIYQGNKFIQDSFEECGHDVSMSFRRYCNNGKESFLTNEEKKWLIDYLDSLEEVDKKSDVFRFPFENDFLLKYRNKFLKNIDVANNLIQAFCLVKKCIQKGDISDCTKFNGKLFPQFFIFASHGIGNCYFWQRLSDEGFQVKVEGYINVTDYIYRNQQISNETKFYPLMFMFRNTIELCLKRLFYRRVDDGVPMKVFFSKRKSHLIKKDLWKNVKPVILKYANDSECEMKLINIVENLIEEISKLDKNGDNFRYPTSYSLEYRFDDKKIDIKNVYTYLRALVNFLDSCDDMLAQIVEYQSEMEAVYAAEIQANNEWY